MGYPFLPRRGFLVNLATPDRTSPSNCHAARITKSKCCGNCLRTSSRSVYKSALSSRKKVENYSVIDATFGRSRSRSSSYVTSTSMSRMAASIHYCHIENRAYIVPMCATSGREKTHRERSRVFDLLNESSFVSWLYPVETALVLLEQNALFEIPEPVSDPSLDQ